MCILLSLYILVVGPPLLVYSVLTRNVDPLYWAGVKGVMFFVNCVGVRVRVKGTERIPAGTCIFAANHTTFSEFLSDKRLLAAANLIQRDRRGHSVEATAYSVGFRDLSAFYRAFKRKYGVTPRELRDCSLHVAPGAPLNRRS